MPCDPEKPPLWAGAHASSRQVSSTQLRRHVAWRGKGWAQGPAGWCRLQAGFRPPRAFSPWPCGPERSSHFCGCRALSFAGGWRERRLSCPLGPSWLGQAAGASGLCPSLRSPPCLGFSSDSAQGFPNCAHVGFSPVHFPGRSRGGRPLQAARRLGWLIWKLSAAAECSSLCRVLQNARLWLSVLDDEHRPGCGCVSATALQGLLESGTSSLGCRQWGLLPCPPGPHAQMPVGP